jgi:hypothetical protein
VDLKRQVEGKEAAVEKLRKEKDELWAIVNTDKYKNIRVIEQDRERAERVRAEVEAQVKGLKEAQEHAQ